MSTEVKYDRHRGEHVIILTLDADEAENVADALGWRDGAHRELYEAAAEARALDAPALSDPKEEQK